MTRYLTVTQLLFVHARLVAETGGSSGVRDLGLLEAAAARPQATFDGRRLHATLFDQAAALMDSVVNNHPFVDGNKRVGITAAALFLRQNGHRLNATNDELEAFTLRVAAERVGLDEIATWLRDHGDNAS